MTELDDKALLEFVAQFVGWKPGRGIHVRLWEMPIGATYCTESNIPNYVHSVDAWIKDVWPKVVARGEHFIDEWALSLEEINDELYERADWGRISNSSALLRCRALWRALNGKLPKRK